MPSGVVTFVFTDIVGSTRLWESVPAEMDRALARHGEIVTAAMAAHGGVVLRERGEGDSTFSFFTWAKRCGRGGVGGTGGPGGGTVAARRTEP